MRFTPNPGPVVEKMLQSIGLAHLEDLFTDIPESLRLKRDLNLPEGLSELELRRLLSSLAAKNSNLDAYPCFLGAGVYDHYIPAALEQLLLRSEFYTAYTPYQAEISQGILQSIFEYQTMICQLTEMDVANASIYDGASALAEACQVAHEVTRRKKILVAPTLHPEYLQVIQTYGLSEHYEIELLPEKDGVLDREAAQEQIREDLAALIIQQPNFYGNLEDLQGWAELVHRVKGLFILTVDPISLAILKSPGAFGADLVVGEGQALGNPLSFGGPHLGFMAATHKLMRKIPGRIVGQTLDEDGVRSFVLTLQAREQHIRRDKATSNICSNHALNALTANIFLSLVGPQGLKNMATQSHQLAVYAQKQLAAQGFPLKYTQPFFREFVVQAAHPEELNARLLSQGIIGGYALPEGLMLAFTEKRTKKEIDQLVAVMGGGLSA